MAEVWATIIPLRFQLGAQGNNDGSNCTEKGEPAETRAPSTSVFPSLELDFTDCQH